MNSGIILSKAAVYAPPTIITNADLEKIVDTSDEWIIQRTGISERRISFDKNVRDMGLEAAKTLIEETEVDKEKIDEVVFTTNRHHLEQEFPSHAAYVAGKLGLREGIPIHDETAGCTGIVYALRGAYNSLKTEKDKNLIMVIASEDLTGMTDYSDRNTCVLFGSGASAYFLAREDKEGIIKNVVKGKPDTRGLLGLRYKEGTKLRRSSDPSKKFELYRHSQNYLEMDGKRVFPFATNAMQEAVHEVLEGTGYTLEDVAMIIPHGANIRIVEAAQERLIQKGYNGQIFTNLNKYGNTSTASVGIAQDEVIREGFLKPDGSRVFLKPNDLYIIVMFGAGLTYGANLIRHQNFPSHLYR